MHSCAVSAKLESGSSTVPLGFEGWATCGQSMLTVSPYAKRTKKHRIKLNILKGFLSVKNGNKIFSMLPSPALYYVRKTHNTIFGTFLK